MVTFPIETIYLFIFKADPGSTPINMASMSEDLAKQKLALEKDVEMAEKDKLKALNQLKKKELEVEKTVKNQKELEEQMKKIEQKVSNSHFRNQFFITTG